MHPAIKQVTDRIKHRSRNSRAAYLELMTHQAGNGRARAHLTCGNLAHAYAASGEDKSTLKAEVGPNLGIVTAFNDMLSAHQPFETYPNQIKEAVREEDATDQVAAGVPAMCDGVTQGQVGMELSLLSRDAIAMSAAIGLSHNVFDAAAFLGVCDKIVPGLMIAAARFGHLPTIFLPAGPMRSGIPNDKKAQARKDYAEGKIDRDALMTAEMASYHSAGTCTFYGTANSNQMLMEIMGLHLPGASFVNPDTPLRDALTVEGARQVIRNADDGPRFCDIADERAFVNGIVGLMATGGSTNLLIHLLPMAAASGIRIDWQDLAEISAVVPLLARVYPNGLADVNQFQAAGGLQFLIYELLGAGLLHRDVATVVGQGLDAYTREPSLRGGTLVWRDGPSVSTNDKIAAPISAPFQTTGGLAALRGNLGNAVIKTSAVAPEHRLLTAPVAVFEDQHAVQEAFRAGNLDRDLVVVVRYQGPRANGMPELHGLTPPLTILQGRGHTVALVTDGRMSGASGKVPAAIHLSPEALDGGAIAQLQDGDVVTLDAGAGRLFVHDDAVLQRPINHPDLAANDIGLGRELFAPIRATLSRADQGASLFRFEGDTE